MKKWALTFSLLVYVIAGYTQDEVLVGWSFPNYSVVADTGLAINIENEIISFGGTSEIDFKNGYETKAAQVTGWNEGMDTKGWMISFSTIEYSGITVSSRQQSGGNDPGPKDFDIQFSTDEGISWTYLEGGSITVENNWESGFLDQLALPEEADNQNVLVIRWLMASNQASGGGGTVMESGKSKIDEIYIKGTKINTVHNHFFSDLKIGPNPVSNQLFISSSQEFQQFQLVDITGKIMISKTLNKNEFIIDMLKMKEGIYFLLIFGASNNEFSSKKINKIK